MKKMKNKLLISTIFLGTVFLSESPLIASNTRTVRCKEFTAANFPYKDVCRFGDNCWTVKKNGKFKVRFFQKWDGVEWIGKNYGEIVDVWSLEQISYPEIGIFEGEQHRRAPYCLYSFLFDGKKDHTVKVLSNTDKNNYFNCKKTKDKNTLSCEEKE